MGKKIYELYDRKSYLKNQAKNGAAFSKLGKKFYGKDKFKKLLIEAVNYYLVFEQILTVNFEGKSYRLDTEIQRNSNELFAAKQCASSTAQSGSAKFVFNSQNPMCSPRTLSFRAALINKLIKEKEEKRKNHEEKNRLIQTKIRELQKLDVLGEIVSLDKITEKIGDADRIELKKLSETCVRTDQTVCQSIKTLKEKIVDKIIAFRIREEKRLAEEKQRAELKKQLEAKIIDLMEFELEGKKYKLISNMFESSFTEVLFLARSCAKDDDQKCSQFDKLKKSAIANFSKKLEVEKVRIEKEKKIAQKKRIEEKKRLQIAKAKKKQNQQEANAVKGVADLYYAYRLTALMCTKKIAQPYQREVQKMFELFQREWEKKGSHWKRIGIRLKTRVGSNQRLKCKNGSKERGKRWSICMSRFQCPSAVVSANVRLCPNNYRASE